MSDAPAITVLARGRPGYPAELEHIDDPPTRLFVAGRLSDRPRVAIVGSRACTAYGRAVATALATALARRGLTIVSGLARGIDAAAHRGALRAGETIAVLPGGLRPIYPPRHRALAWRIVARGALVAEREPGAEVAPWHFPRRNRIIAGLSLVTVVVEAAARSGARITADLALAYGREVLVVPGPITSPTSAGCHALLAQGAQPCTSAADVIEQLPPQVRDALPRPAGDTPGDPVDPLQRRILHRLRSEGPAHLARLADTEGAGTAAAVTRLELLGLVEVLADGRVCISPSSLAEGSCTGPGLPDRPGVG